MITKAAGALTLREGRNFILYAPQGAPPSLGYTLGRMGCTDARILFGILAGRRALMNMKLIDTAKVALSFRSAKLSGTIFFI